MYIFENKNLFFQTLHPVSLLIYMGIMVIGGILITNPIILLGFMVSMVLVINANKDIINWLINLKYYIPMVLVILLLNILINNMGATLIWSGPYLPVFGRINISMENMVYSFVMGFRLLLIYSVFSLYNKVMDPDKAITIFSRVFPKSALLVALTTKTIPHMGRQLQNAAQIQQCRGVQYYSGNYIDRIKNRFPLLKVLLLSSLEDSFQIGESIQARAYGSGPRSCYNPISFQIRDTLVIISSLCSLMILIYMVYRGWGNIVFYPRVGGLSMDVMVLAGLLFFINFPVLLAWGWEKWQYLRFRI